jgi:uncharacterized protein (DUF1015 family)
LTLIRPIPACLPSPDLAADVATPPLGGLTVSDWLSMLEGNPHSFVHVIRAGVDTPEGGPDDVAASASGRPRLDAMIAAGVVSRPHRPAFYVYQIESRGVSAAAVVGEVSVDAYGDGRIRRHEETRTPTEDLLARHLVTVGAHTDPVSLTYHADGEIDRLLGEVREGAPLLDFVTGDGTRQRVWRVDAARQGLLQGRLDRVGTLYITDGHHRLAAAARYARWREANGGGPGPDPGYRYVLAALFSDADISVFEFNRCVAAVDEGVLALVERLRPTLTVGDLDADADPRPTRRGSIGMIGAGHQWMIAIPRSLIPADAYGALDAVLLQDLVLGPHLGITDPRTDPRLRYITGPAIPDPGAHDCDVCFLLYATEVADVLAVADAGLVMPPKSTWFEPKVWGGVFIRLLD